MTLRVPLNVYRRWEEWIQAGCGAPSPSLPPSIQPSFIHPSVRKQALKCLLTTGERAERRASAASGRSQRVTEWETNGTWCTLDPPGYGPQSCIPETAPPTLYRTGSAWLLTGGAWCKECKLRASDVDFLNSEHGNGEMLLFFYTHRLKTIASHVHRMALMCTDGAAESRLSAS